MKRSVMEQLIKWKDNLDHKPLLIRGARQVGKSYLVQELGRGFTNFAELNFELNPDFISLFEDTIEPEVLVMRLSVALECRITAGETLLFLDEVQYCPRAITSLRYFYEKMPDLHVIAAGSLVDFALEETGIPVGRVRSLYLYPMSFHEFLVAYDERMLVDHLMQHDPGLPLPEAFHNKLLRLLGEYLAVGGMPEAVRSWLEHKQLDTVTRIHSDLIESFRQDFSKYVGRKQIRYVDTVFNSIPRLLGKKFVYQSVDREVRSRELKPALTLLAKAGIANIVTHSSANGIPLGAEATPSLFKVLFLDIGLAQTLLGLKRGAWILDTVQTIVNRGAIAEAFVGQELLAYNDPFSKHELYYWVREKTGANAEVDYITASNSQVIPIEVKSGKTGSLKSLQIFLSEKVQSPYGLHFSQRTFSSWRKIRSYPLYAVKLAVSGNQEKAKDSGN